MTGYAVEENVTLVANDATRVLAAQAPVAPQANDACRLACIRRLKSVVETGVVLLDDAGDLLKRYRGFLSGKGQPGTGDAFFKHLCDQQYNQQKVRLVTLKKDQQGNFESYPSDKRLSRFDINDRIYVALVRATSGKARILNAVDSDYAHVRQALIDNSVKVIELCPDCVKQSKEVRSGTSRSDQKKQKYGARARKRLRPQAD